MIQDIDDTKMPLLDHLIELRRRLLWSVVALAIGFFICLYFARDIFAFLAQPLLKAGQGKIIYTDIFEAFFVEIKVAFFSAMMLAFPVIATQIWRFVAPGLYANEKKAFLPFLLMTPVLFTAGAAMAYYVAMPVALQFLLGFSGDVGGIQQEALPGVGNYLGFVMKFLFGFGVAFLLPVLLMLLEREVRQSVPREALLRYEDYFWCLSLIPVAVVGGYIFMAFGFLSRRCERQADVFGCRSFGLVSAKNPRPGLPEGQFLLNDRPVYLRASNASAALAMWKTPACRCCCATRGRATSSGRRSRACRCRCT